jgi:BASS family bile acid:Na+ symporter
VTQLFPVWAVLFAGAAWLWPGIFTPLRPAIEPLLGVVMFGMGVTLTAREFGEVVRRPVLLGFGMALQYGIMPLAAFGVAKALRLEPQLAAGLVLVGSCPGGTASNVICYLARADVALSITLTALSTLLAVVATPLLTELYIGRSVVVDVAGMIASIFRVVIVPVVLGVALNAWLGPRLARAQQLLPALSMAAIVLIIAIVVALSHDRLAELTGPTVVAVVLVNAIGLAGGYALPRLVRLSEPQCRTLAIEVGMQNSGLAVALALQHFSPLAALPGALFSVWHNVSGSLLAGLWSRRTRP